MYDGSWAQEDNQRGCTAPPESVVGWSTCREPRSLRDCCPTESRSVIRSQPRVDRRR